MPLPKISITYVASPLKAFKRIDFHLSGYQDETFLLSLHSTFANFSSRLVPIEPQKHIVIDSARSLLFRSSSICSFKSAVRVEGILGIPVESLKQVCYPTTPVFEYICRTLISGPVLKILRSMTFYPSCGSLS